MVLLLKTFAALGVAVCVLASSPALGAAPPASPNDTARFLAGLPPAQGSPLAPLAQEPPWQQHAHLLNGVWAGLEEHQLSKVRAWSRANVTARRAVTYYFFSGPDFLYADAFLPGSSTYILAGLEPIGPLPDVLALRSLGHDLDSLRTSISTLLSRSYFITSYMGADLSASQLRGILPVLYVFLARTGKTIHEVSFVSLRPDGSVEPSGEGKDGARGVRIVFFGPDKKHQTLYYFRTDLANKAVQTSGFLEFCRRFGIGDVFIKAASYLLHTPQFSIVRDFLLGHGATVVQDDTGVPLKFFEQRSWKVQPFGRYVGPIPVFRGHFQSKLKTLFEKSGAPPIDFGIGYRWRLNESHVILAINPDPQNPASPAVDKQPQEKPGPAKGASNLPPAPQPGGEAARLEKNPAPDKRPAPAPEQRAAAEKAALPDKKPAPDKATAPGAARSAPDNAKPKSNASPPPKAAPETPSFVQWPSVLFGGLFSAALVGVFGLEGVAAGAGFVLQTIAIGAVAWVAVSYVRARPHQPAVASAATAEDVPSERRSPAESAAPRNAGGTASKGWPVGLAERLRRLAAR